MRLLYSCSELGLGHASRTVALGKQLEMRGHEVHFFSGGRAFDLFKKEFKRVYPATPVAWYENDSGIVTSASIINILFPLPYFSGESGKFRVKNSSAMETIRRYDDLRQHLHNIRPELIISDGDIHALRLSGRWRIPSVYITNLIRPSIGFMHVLNPGERFTERYVRCASKIVIPDNPPPYTICEYNIGDLDYVRVADKTEFTGSFFDTSPSTGSAVHIFAPISGPYGTRAKLTRMLVPVLQNLETKSVVSLGLPGERRRGKVGNCTIYTWLTAKERKEFMHNASMVIFSGGHITCFETIKNCKPSICIPTQPEQMANAFKLRDLKCSIIAKNKKQLEEAALQIQENYCEFKDKMEAINRISSKYNGLKQAVEIVESAYH